MKIDGELSATAIFEWYKGYVARYPGLDLDLGKFYFATSTGTVGALIAFEKLSTSSTSITTLLILTFIFLAISILISFLLILPSPIDINKNPNALAVYEKVTLRINRITVLWFITWFLGAGMGAINAVFL